ncbi:EndoU domain-containing protein [Paraburkholderia bonniea]|uniref:EndoU domain-containing protein n=1 Tax=Paraburkholderia bonniea TaxID=2152891 RepID=UPI0012925188|nr:EndoU domain-containing protein [Paraburkholderia bonniea]
MQSESARAALHGIVGCAGAAASRQGCGAGALGASVSSVLGSLMGSTTGMSAQDRQARENLVTSLVAGIATVSGANAATTVSAGLTEVENNQVALPPPGPLVFPLGSGLPPFKLPGYRPEQAQKGDGVIADPATQLDPTIMAGRPLIYPMLEPAKIEALITAVVPDSIRQLVQSVVNAMSSDSRKTTNTGNNSLLDPQGENHVLYGDGPTSGGHLSGVGNSGKSEFPANWSAQDITNAISDIATDPNIQWSKPAPNNGYVSATGTINGVDIRVIIDPAKGRIVTGYPTNLPRNPR